jgi:hypothetical protein
MRIAESTGGNTDSVIRTWIIVAAATIAWLLPIPWYGGAALFLAAVLPLGVFYPLPIGSQK